MHLPGLDRLFLVWSCHTRSEGGYATNRDEVLRETSRPDAASHAPCDRPATVSEIHAPHLPRMALTLAYKAFPSAVLPFTAQKPVMPSSLRASDSARPHFFKPLDSNTFLECADAALLTILPLLFFIKVSFVRPVTVFVFLPLKTAALASL